MTAADAEVRILRDVWMSAAAELEQAGIEDARFEAEVLLRHAAGLSRAQLYANLSDTLAEDAAAKLRDGLAQRCGRKPLAYITRTREFYRLSFEVSPDVLIPRPESELLVDTALDHLKRARIRNGRIADVGCGSGALGIAVARNARRMELLCTDISRDALAVASRNAGKLLPRRRPELVQADLLSGVLGPFHCIVANLPYIPEDRLPTLEPEVARNEPRIALASGKKGTEHNLRLVPQLASRLAPNGVAVLEIDPGQEDEVAGAAHRLMPDAEIAILNDFAERPRAVRIAC